MSALPAEQPGSPVALEQLAQELGMLLKCYAGEISSTHDLMALLNAFQSGLKAENHYGVTLTLPMRPRQINDSSFWDGHIPKHDINREEALLVQVAADFVFVTTRRLQEFSLQQKASIPQGVMCASDLTNEFLLETKTSLAGKRRRETILPKKV